MTAGVCTQCPARSSSAHCCTSATWPWEKRQGCSAARVQSSESQLLVVLVVLVVVLLVRLLGLLRMVLVLVSTLALSNAAANSGRASGVRTPSKQGY